MFLKKYLTFRSLDFNDLDFELDMRELEAEFGVEIALPRRHTYDRVNVLEEFNRPGEFQSIFGVSKEVFKYLVEVGGENLINRREDNPTALSPNQKVAIFLEYLRTNQFHRSVGTQSYLGMITYILNSDQPKMTSAS